MRLSRLSRNTHLADTENQEERERKGEQERKREKSNLTTVRGLSPVCEVLVLGMSKGRQSNEYEIGSDLECFSALK